MEIFLDKQAVRQIRLSAADAIEEGDVEALQEDIFEAIPEEAAETLESMLPDGDFMSLLTELLEEWSGDDVDELFELLETSLGDHGIDLKYSPSDDDEEYEYDDDETEGVEGFDDDDGFDPDDEL